MKRFALIAYLLLATVPIFAQEFIGCRTDRGWAETPIFRKTFTVDKKAKNKVYANITSLGYHDLYINNIKVGDYVMQPAVSQLDKRALTVCYDITDYIKIGKNEIIIQAGQGWGRIYGTPAAVSAEVECVFRNGEKTLATTDNTWESTPSGYSYTGSWQPMQFGGERYDARVKPDWRPASIYDAKQITVSRQEFKGNHIIDTLKPHSITKEADNSIVIDFGRVVTGWFQADFPTLAAEQEVTMEYLDHIKAKPPHTETDVYIADGNGHEHFTNRFHLHAFRYVRIKGAGIVSARALQISAINSKGGATFECSDPRLNDIHDMVKYTLSCLTFSGYMVDCPHIERMGYGGDGNSSTMTLQTIWDVHDTYKNWLTAWGDALDSTGDLPYVAPAFHTGGGPYWSGFIIKAPWRTYLNYGDPSFIKEHYEEMCLWLDFVAKHCKDGLLQPWPDTERRGWFLGDWLAPEGVDIGGESVLHVSNCFIAECLEDMTQMAHLTGHSADSARYAEWCHRLKTSIHKHFYHPETHTYANGTPLDQAYALLMDIPPDSVTAGAVKDQLIKDCHGKYRDHIAAGLMGVPIFTEWCIRERETELMATILQQPDYPGYLDMIDNGATTTWESWDCGREGKEDRSRVHNCYNGIGTWFYQSLAGIRPDPEQPGYKHFFIDPQPLEGVDTIRVAKPTPYGTIRVDIERSWTNQTAKPTTILKVEIPEGTTATIFPNTINERTVGAGKWVF